MISKVFAGLLLIDSQPIHKARQSLGGSPIVRRHLLHICVSVLLAAPIASHASTVLVGAPTAGDDSYDSQGNIPASGPIFYLADEFSLSSSESVAAITAQLFGVPTSPSTSELDLVTSLTSVTPLYHIAFSSPPQSLTAVSLPINGTLSAGTYFLRLDTNGFIGWGVSNGSFVTTDGTVVDGIWDNDTSANARWIFTGGDRPGAFSVVSSVPLPPSAWLLLSGLAGVILVVRRTSGVSEDRSGLAGGARVCRETRSARVDRARRISEL